MTRERTYTISVELPKMDGPLHVVVHKERLGRAQSSHRWATVEETDGTLLARFDGYMCRTLADAFLAGYGTGYMRRHAMEPPDGS